MEKGLYHLLKFNGCLPTMNHDLKCSLQTLLPINHTTLIEHFLFMHRQKVHFWHRDANIYKFV